MISIEQLQQQYPQHIESVVLGETTNFSQVSPVHRAEETSLVFALQETYLKTAIESPAAIIVTKPKFSHLCTNPEKSYVLSPLPEFLVTRILQDHFYKTAIQKLDKLGVHESAIVYEGVTIPASSYIGAYSVIGKDAKIGEHVYIGENVIIEDGAQIGDHSWVHPLCFIGEGSHIGKHCILRSGTVVGSSPSEAHMQKKVAKGICHLEDYVETGSNTCIDRAIEGVTKIGEASKLDNMVKISEGAQLGPKNLITAGVQIGARATTGAFFMIGGNSFVDADVNICNMVMAGGMSYIDQNIEKPGSYGGNPIQEMRDYLKTTTSLSQLPKLRRYLSKLDEV